MFSSYICMVVRMDVLHKVEEKKIFIAAVFKSPIETVHEIAVWTEMVLKKLAVNLINSIKLAAHILNTFKDFQEIFSYFHHFIDHSQSNVAIGYLH